jgi:Skp family chaperone for outer membrane proteins
MKKLFFIVLTLLGSPAHAEIFKCLLKSGKTIYQSTPCEAAVKQQTIEIQQPDPRKVAEEEAKLNAWKEDFEKRETERIKAEKERQLELDRKASVEALKKSAQYQQQQAYEAKRQADALERQTMQPTYQPQFYPFYPTYPSYQEFPAYPSHLHHHQDSKEKAVIEIPQSRQTEIKTDKDTNSSKPLLRGYR